MSPFEPQRHRDKEAHGKQMRYEMMNDKRFSQSPKNCRYAFLSSLLY